MNKEDIKAVLSDYCENIDLSLDEDGWFQSIKDLAVRHGFADNIKVWKKNKEAYKGHVGDVSEFLRIALSGKRNSPNLYCVMQILGKEKRNSPNLYCVMQILGKEKVINRIMEVLSKI